MLKVTEVKCLGLDPTLEESRSGTHAGTGCCGHVPKIFLKSIKKTHQLVLQKSGWSLPPKWRSLRRHHRLHFLVLFNAGGILLGSAPWAAVSSGGPGETGGTARSAGTRTSSRGCSGTGRIPERCFGNSGENWSAGGRKGRKGVTGGRREWLGVFILTARAPASDPRQPTADVSSLIHFAYLNPRPPPLGRRVLAGMEVWLDFCGA